jgi:hypothetical protein
MQQHGDTHRRGGYDEVMNVRSVYSGKATDLPSQGRMGDIYFATDTNTLYIYNGTAWRSISTSA